MHRDLRKLLAEMTLEEKASLCSGLDFWSTKGIERLGIPSIMLTDGPHGLRKQRASADHLGLFDSVPATCFPSAAGLASSWDRDLIRKVGEALGEECQAEDVAVLLGPGANIKRSPLCGRNFEYFSEDPFLSAELAASHIQGVQIQGVGASLKHFAVNNQEHRRMTIDAIVDERTLREIYLASFEGAVNQGRPWTVMCSYNKVNGEYASEHVGLLTEILKEEWGFEGFTVSDWGAVNERTRGLAAGLDLEMPGNGGAGDREIVSAVRRGDLPEEAVDRAVMRVLSVIFKAADGKREGAAYDPNAHHRLAREVARESMVLLKNEGELLPLPKTGKIALIGEMAVRPRYQGGGSSHVNPTRMDDLREQLLLSAGGGVEIVYSQGYELDRDDEVEELSAEAVRVAEEADVAIVVLGLPERFESEGFDRSHLRLPDNQSRLLEAVSKVQSRIVAILSNGSSVEMPWLSSAGAILEAYLGGQALGGALADLIFGDANPSGKLAETFPVDLRHNPSHPYFPGEGDRVEYREGIFVGYRYYDAKNIEPLFPFGHGLSYTTFQYSGLSVDKKDMEDTDSLTIQVEVSNTGDRPGKEVVQLYVRDVHSGVIRPEKELKGFAKVYLEPGQSRTITFQLDKRAFAYYNTDIGDWAVESGDFEMLVGKSSAQIELRETVFVHSKAAPGKKYTRNTAIGDLMTDPRAIPAVQGLLANTPFGASSAIANEDSISAMMAAALKDMPLRGLAAFSGGAFSNETIDEMLRELNAD
ncbi:glycoside hydrolase family 3 C-terminal domain-containing protein [Cohnella herbarum]|uniref:Glycosyl hydrolase n=1 Tax=Cohnella herbarum TaxID=2728023 RepID=A0A7Z2VH19_9BACL|nr:glycoside hydrolase family 3 C-terminal domain-containing protein [Cohnella herbarum]QJD82840.1 glycosyl hydrolase [Cohnella herbarum]